MSTLLGKAYEGPLIPYYFLVIYNIPCTIRSLIHILFEDGGAHSIAGMKLGNDVASKNVVAMFAQWGASQLVLAVIIWFVVLERPEFTSAMLAICELELVLRFLVSRFKKCHTAHEPPGGTSTKVLLPLVLSMWCWSTFGTVSLAK